MLHCLPDMNTKLDLIIDEDCPACKRAEDELTVYTSERSFIELKVSLVGTSEYDKISIVPALIVDGKLYNYGEIDFKKLSKKLKV